MLLMTAPSPSNPTMRPRSLAPSLTEIVHGVNALGDLAKCLFVKVDRRRKV